ncbi:MAG: tRNA epoxyqueuosine(34) reductase QueG [Telmatospirillum sp.]|nr:tRNA epoxyqueuosine(34) reductase QueG [Telmatospirillum sp.]
MAPELKEEIRAKALEVGFATARFTRAAPVAGAARDLAGYLEAGCHGDMGWMAEHADRRGSPQVLWAGARSIVVLGENYGPGRDPLASLGAADRGHISVYARGRDYHDVLKKRLKTLARWMVERCGGEVKVFTDTAPVMEKPLAGRSGLGWQGRHTNLVSRQFGSWLFLGEIFTTLEIEPDPPMVNHCGQCRSCETACPTGALADGRIDPRRCISYLTIESKGHIPAGLRPLIGNRIYGCDDCLAVCPWNKFASPTGEPAYLPRAELMAPRLADLAQLDASGFRELFSGSPIKRIGRDRFVRNVLIAIGNSPDAGMAAVAIRLVADPSPLVRGAAAWAVRRLLPSDAAGRLAIIRLGVESDPDVRTEWVN